MSEEEVTLHVWMGLENESRRTFGSVKNESRHIFTTVKASDCRVMTAATDVSNFNREIG